MPVISRLKAILPLSINKIENDSELCKKLNQCLKYVEHFQTAYFVLLLLVTLSNVFHVIVLRPYMWLYIVLLHWNLICDRNSCYCVAALHVTVFRVSLSRPYMWPYCVFLCRDLICDRTSCYCIETLSVTVGHIIALWPNLWLYFTLLGWDFFFDRTSCYLRWNVICDRTSRYCLEIYPWPYFVLCRCGICVSTSYYYVMV